MITSIEQTDEYSSVEAHLSIHQGVGLLSDPVGQTMTVTMRHRPTHGIYIATIMRVYDSPDLDKSDEMCKVVTYGSRDPVHLAKLCEGFVSSWAAQAEEMVRNVPDRRPRIAPRDVRYRAVMKYSDRPATE